MINQFDQGYAHGYAAALRDVSPTHDSLLEDVSKLQADLAIAQQFQDRLRQWHPAIYAYLKGIGSPK
jgi:hypothetical protein